MGNLSQFLEIIWRYITRIHFSARPSSVSINFYTPLARQAFFQNVLDDDHKKPRERESILLAMGIYPHPAGLFLGWALLIPGSAETHLSNSGIQLTRIVHGRFYKSRHSFDLHCHLIPRLTLQPTSETWVRDYADCLPSARWKFAAIPANGRSQL